MSNKIKHLVCCIVIFSCKKIAITNSYNKHIKESYIYDFKIKYFKKLLVAGFNNSESIKKIVDEDRSGYGESILSIEDYKIIDSVIKNDTKIIIQDSINKVGAVSEGAQGKHIFTYALNKFDSKWLDSLSKARYFFFKKNN